MTVKSYKVTVRIALILWTLLVLYGSLAPGSDLPMKSWWGSIPHFDKLVHFGFYFVETLLLILGFYYSRMSVKVLMVLAVVIFSGFIEVLQGAFFGRSRDVSDLVANTLGVLCAPGAAVFVHRMVCRLPGLSDRDRSV